MDAGDGVKRIGRADQPQQLAGRAGSLRELLLSRRLFSTFSCRYSLAEPQPQRHNEWTRTSIYAWRVVLSMHILNGSSSQPVARPVALPNPRRSGVRKTGAPSRFSYIGCVPPIDNSPDWPMRYGRVIAVSQRQQSARTRRKRAREGESGG